MNEIKKFYFAIAGTSLCDRNPENEMQMPYAQQTRLWKYFMTETDHKIKIRFP
jgi:hypothetical protein